jgi:formylglycine-generating enzyme required for sulfatase activity
MRVLLLAAVLLPALAMGAATTSWVRVPGGNFRSTLKYEDTGGRVRVATFGMMREPVTNAQYLDFVRKHPDWQRGRTPLVYAESRYLQHWAAPLVLGARALPRQPVTQVSWFAADAYCAAQGARLPTWSEWEYAAAADATRRDARKDPAWRERILSWYARPAGAPLALVGQGVANVYGLHDLHGLVWEWTEDYASMLVSGDSRDQKSPDRRLFCGAGSIGMDDTENYAVMMRVAMLSALEGSDVTSSLGFRCARDIH